MSSEFRVLFSKEEDEEEDEDEEHVKIIFCTLCYIFN